MTSGEETFHPAAPRARRGRSEAASRDCRSPGGEDHDASQHRTAEAKALAADLVKIFDSKQIHREALAALRLLHESVKQERATADLARSVLAYLFLARHNEELRFEG